MDAALWEHRWECRYFTSLAVCACVCMPVCACIWNRERGLERERERWGRVSISWSLYLCVHLYGLSYFSSLPLSFFSFSIFPLTTSITLKMNITWHGGTYFYDLLYSLTRTFCSLLKRRQHNRHKKSSVISGAYWPWVDEDSPSIYLLSYWQQLFQRKFNCGRPQNSGNVFMSLIKVLMASWKCSKVDFAVVI